jgi:hypothetical protein
MEETLQEIGGHAAAAAEQFTELLWRVYHHHQDMAHFPKGCAASLAKKWGVIASASTCQTTHEKGPARLVRCFSTLLEGLQEADKLYNEYVR